jgi:hypothetical protein
MWLFVGPRRRVGREDEKLYRMYTETHSILTIPSSSRMLRSVDNAILFCHHRSSPMIPKVGQRWRMVVMLGEILQSMRVHASHGRTAGSTLSAIPYYYCRRCVLHAAVGSLMFPLYFSFFSLFFSGSPPLTILDRLRFRATRRLVSSSSSSSHPLLLLPEGW